MKYMIIGIVLIAAGFYFFQSVSFDGAETLESGEQESSQDLVQDAKNLSFSTNVAADIKNTQTSLEIMMTEMGTYPLVGEKCQGASILEKHMEPYYLHKKPTDEFNVAVSEDGYRYVLQVPMSDVATILLENDKDGQILGCDCDDPNYCVTEYEMDMSEEEMCALYGECYDQI
jgi:hypothetical protein